MVVIQVSQMFLIYMYLLTIIFILQYFSYLNYDMLQTLGTEIISIFQRLSISADFISKYQQRKTDSF